MANDYKELIDNEMLIRKEICGIKLCGNKESISRELLNLNMFVEAGAGAGKTYTIVQRVLNQLCIGIKPSEIVVITFTNKAAEELRGRIAKQLRDRVKDEEYLEYRQELKDALSHLDDMNISTIHSFCFKLLKERCFDATLPMDIGLLDNEGTDEQKSVIFHQWVSSLTGKDWDELIKKDPNKRTRSAIIGEIYGIYNKISTLPKEKRVHVDMPGKDCKEAEKNLKDLYEELEELIVDGVNGFVRDHSISSYEDIYNYSASLGTNKKLLGSAWFKDGNEIIKKQADGRIDYKQFFLSFLTGKSDARTGNNLEKVGYRTLRPQKTGALVKSGFKKDSNETIAIDNLNEEIRQYLEDHIEDLNNALNEEVIIYRGIINSYAQKAKEYYARQCSIFELTNDALLEKTRDMILGSDDAVRYFSGKYSCFYVDEFQDTDNVQESFIWRLASKEDDHEKLRDGALFIVGDPKQSIYRFRGAEPEVYLSVQKRMKEIQDAGGNARVYDLQINFRSNDLIIKWVNDKFASEDGFSPIMKDKNGASYKYHNMIARNILPDYLGAKLGHDGYSVAISLKNKEKIIAGVYRFLVSESGDDFASKEDKAIVEAVNKRSEALAKLGGEAVLDEKNGRDMQAVTDLILNLCNNKEFKIMDGGNARDIRFSDFLVLCRSKPNMNKYLEYMSLRGIPVQIAGSTDPKAIMEMNAFVRIYSYLANRKSQMDRVAAIEAFRCLQIAEKEEDIENYSLAILDHMSRECREIAPYAMALYILEHISVILKKNRGFSAFEVTSLQAKIVQMIETVCRDNLGTAKDIAEKFYEYLDNEIEHELSLQEKTDAVQFMNIHKSKGLEGNIVIIMDRHGTAPKVSSLMRDNEYYPRPSQYPDLKEKELSELKMEDRRLEYVTATRAGQVLIFMDNINSKPLFHGEDGARYNLKELQTIAPAIVFDDPHTEPARIEKCYDLDNEEKSSRDNIFEEDEESILPTIQGISPSGFENGHSKTKSEAIERAKKSGEYYRGVEYSIRRPMGNIFGTTMHRALELLADRYSLIKGSDENTQKKLLEGCVSQAVSENIDLLTDMDIQDYKLFLGAVVRTYFHELINLGWLDGENVFHYTELNFSYYEKESSGDDSQLYYANKHLKEKEKLKEAPVWMNGSADLVIRKNAGTDSEEILIVDYKSDNDNFLTEEEFHKSMSEKYIGQLDNYGYAMKKLYGVPDDRITMKVVSFSQKDENGNAYKDGKVRVRITEIDRNVVAG